MKLFILSDKLPLMKRIKFAAVFINSGLTILTGKNLSFSFQTTLIEQLSVFGADTYQQSLPTDETIILLTNNGKLVKNTS
ncbi:hypothetical protein [Pantoea agglomerans]|uniref:hypothetical protein n=1 Tax=Enterobacter agglomerans TaxID=549 RepID=UPI000B7A0F6C|nr:hypothetical protein [Pantoea agglomerans]OXH80200.1 hypothetical protein CBI57_02570 [Pantoea agglomerans]